MAKKLNFGNLNGGDNAAIVAMLEKNTGALIQRGSLKTVEVGQKLEIDVRTFCTAQGLTPLADATVEMEVIASIPLKQLSDGPFRNQYVVCGRILKDSVGAAVKHSEDFLFNLSALKAGSSAKHLPARYLWVYYDGSNGSGNLKKLVVEGEATERLFRITPDISLLPAYLDPETFLPRQPIEYDTANLSLGDDRLDDDNSGDSQQRGGNNGGGNFSPNRQNGDNGNSGSRNFVPSRPSQDDDEDAILADNVQY